MDGGRITAQLGCGALLLVIVAAYIGAVAGTEGVRPGAGRSARPSIFRVDNLVRPMGSAENPLTPVFKVVEVEGAWVKLEVNPSATERAFAQSLWGWSASEAEIEQATAAAEDGSSRAQAWLAPVLNRYSGQWWVNTANTTEMWQEVQLSAQ